MHAEPPDNRMPDGRTADGHTVDALPPAATGGAGRCDWLALDPLDGDTIRAGLATRRFGHPLEVHTTLGSTLDRLRRLGEQGAAAGTAVLAEEQSAGRGRRGRRWQSAPGLGLWVSVLIEIQDRSPGTLTLSAAVAVRRAILAAGGPALAVKWPNDLELGGRKVCGILCEVAGGPLGLLGIGINVHHAPADYPVALRDRATSLEATGTARIVRNVLAARLLEALEEVDDRLRAGEAPRLLDAWREACAHLGRRVRVIAAPGAEWTGVMRDIDAHGALLLGLPSGEERTVMAGSLHVLDAP